MAKARTASLALCSVLAAFFLLSSVSASSFFSPEYETYVLGAAKHSSGAYSSVETYEKTEVEYEDRFSSRSETTIKRTESETFTPSRSSSRWDWDRYDRDDDRRYSRYDRYNDDDRYDRPRYIYTDSLGRTSFHDWDNYEFRVTDYDTYVRYDDGSWYPSSNWRFKEVYDSKDYPHENDYGYDYYYEPRYDWHLGIYNWRY